MRARFAQREFFGDEVLSVKGLGKSFDGRTLFEDVELDVAGGERIALLGDNGTGKSTFLKVLLGELARTAGKIKFGPTVSGPICRRSSILTIRSERCLTRCSMRRAARCRRRAIGWARICLRARMYSSLSRRSPAGSRAGCGSVC